MEQKKLKRGCSTSVIIGGIGIISLVVAFFFLIRGCLSKYDTFGTIGWPGVTNDQKTLVIVKSYSSTNSYSSQNGVTHISYSTAYYLEQIDLATGKMTKKKKLMNHSKIKKGSLQCFGGYDNKLWVYANELKAFDMNTLEVALKQSDIEDKNPGLKGKFPTEQQYIDPHINLGYITITAQDGDKYRILLKDLSAQPVDPDEDNFEKLQDQFKVERELVNKRIDSMNALVYGSNDYTKYEKISNEREVYYKQRDSLDYLKENAREIFQAQRDLVRELEDFNPFSSDDIGDWLIIRDTLKGNTYELAKEEPKSSYLDLGSFEGTGSETDKVDLYKISYEPNKESHSRYDNLKVVKVEKKGDKRYLQGGFLRDYRTAVALHLKNPEGYIIFSRDIIGNKGKLLVSRVDLNGKQLWQTDAMMSYDVNFAIATENHLIITGIINQDKSPSFSSADALRIFDLKTGGLVAVKY